MALLEKMLQSKTDETQQLAAQLAAAKAELEQGGPSASSSGPVGPSPFGPKPTVHSAAYESLALQYGSAEKVPKSAKRKARKLAVEAGQRAPMTPSSAPQPPAASMAAPPSARAPKAPAAAPPSAWAPETPATMSAIDATTGLQAAAKASSLLQPSAPHR
jgi:hypothetical protein